MKKCYKCKETKSTDEFHKNKYKSDGFQSYCKACAKVRNAEYYKATPHRNPQRQASRDAARNTARTYVWEYLVKNSCVDCGESDLIVLDFDHVRGEKVKNVSQMVHAGLGLDTIKDEIDKCEVRCSNCHRRATARRSGWSVLDFLGMMG